jgi:hypothetical protein
MNEWKVVETVFSEKIIILYFLSHDQQLKKLKSFDILWEELDYQLISYSWFAFQTEAKKSKLTL